MGFIDVVKTSTGIDAILWKKWAFEYSSGSEQNTRTLIYKNELILEKKKQQFLCLKSFIF